MTEEGKILIVRKLIDEYFFYCLCSYSNAGLPIILRPIDAAATKSLPIIIQPSSVVSLNPVIQNSG